MDDSLRVMTICGTAAALLAALAWFADRRRHRRRDLDRVGFMPWTAIFFWSLMAAVLLLGLAGRAWLGG
ncbi:hypothetical protein [Novosphingobium soli]|uniref:Uncharacterized protein n=1 Tax=Novosphingobium soli TaxID=574956 RepID=A0ABV6CWR2_9SPHN